MENRIPFKLNLPDDLLELVEEFSKAGHELFVVGGAVRDAVLGVQSHDYDVATGATPDQVISLLQPKGWELNETGKSFGVVRACKLGREEYEIATFRLDIGEGRRPDSVQFTSINEDVKRRDLTINALFYDAKTEEIVDFVGGLEDIKNEVIRCVGNPFDRFREDKLRILRALRFSARYGWKLDCAASAAMMEEDLSELSSERIHDEFSRGLASAKDPSTYLQEIRFHGLFQSMFPFMNVGRLAVRAETIPEFLALAFEHVEISILRKRLNELKYSDTEIAQACFLIEYASLTTTNAFKLKKRAKACHISERALESFVDSRFRYNFDVPGERLRDFYHLNSAFRKYVPVVAGDDLLKEGFSGKELGIELQRRETVEFERLFFESRTY